MAETYVLGEGAAWLWTGSATASALAAYAQDVSMALQFGQENYRTLDGVWHNRHTGQRADVSLTLLTSRDNSAYLAAVEAGSAVVHMHVKFSHDAGGSAGRYFYSGAIDSLNERAAQQGEGLTWAMMAHFNVWSAYG